MVKTTVKTHTQKLVIGMPISQSRTITTCQPGFTLVEILVVMLIISITFGMAMLAVGDFGKERKIRSAAEGFAQFLQLVHERALLESSTLQVQLNTQGYSSQRMDVQNRWHPLKNSYYHHHNLPNNTRISIVYGSQKPDQLILTIGSSGDMTPFKIHFGSGEHAQLVTIVGSENGTIVVQNVENHP